MARSQAGIGYGTVLEIALADTPETLVYIAETTSHTPPSFTDETVEVTHMQSPNRAREYVAGLTDTGESTHEMNFVPASPTDRFLLSIGGKNLIAYLTFTNGYRMIYSAVRQGYERNIPMDDKRVATLTLKASGDPIMTPTPAAPRNLVSPSIDGIPKVGVPLVADQGIWAGAQDITYQWQAAGVDISGATASAFVPGTANIGDVITVEVTGANADFETVVVSAGTAVVAA